MHKLHVKLVAFKFMYKVLIAKIFSPKEDNAIQF